MSEHCKRLGFVGIIIENREATAPMVNKILHEFSECILARTGLPNAKGTASVITLVVESPPTSWGYLQASWAISLG